MFLMNLAPVSGVSTDWQPFGPSPGFSLPVSFSDPGQEFSAVGSAVKVNVQMIIENLQPNDSPCAMNNDPSNNAQTNAATKRRSEGALDSASIKVLKGASVEDLKTGYLPRALGTEESNLGRCVIDSDSDESIDRGIEEAIQEYLKKKTEDSCLISKAIHNINGPPGTHPASEDSTPNVSNGITVEREAPSAQLELGFVDIDRRGLGLEAAVRSRCSSPSSVSSNDSFELSIQAEIERFLQDKRDKETTTTGGPENEPASGGRPEQKENLVKVGSKNRKRLVKSSGGNQTHVSKPSPVHTDTQVSGTKSFRLEKVGTLCKTEKSNEGNHKCNKRLTSEKKATVMHSFKDLNRSSNAQWNVDAEVSDPKPNPIIAVVELSDSSSDDGIEEAIQLYQLEQKKGKTEDIALVPGLLPHKPSCTPKCADSSSDVCLCGAKSAKKETLQVTSSKKRKHCVLKSGEFKVLCSLNLSETDSSDQSSDDFVTQREKKSTDWRFGWKKRFQAETVSESSPKREGPLAPKMQSSTDSTAGMAPAEREEHTGSSKAISECANADSKQVVSSSDSENSSVDSSDSIEKEIQNYLALKANQSSQKPDGVEAATQLDRTLPPELKREDSLNDSPSLFSSSSSLSSQTSLLQKGRLKNNVGTDHGLCMEELTESQPQEPSGASVALVNRSTVTSKIKLKNGSSEQDIFDTSNVWDGRTANRDREESFPLDWAARELSCVKPVRDAWQTDEKSSSLDSDEDLDTATKDLLKTRKKLGKRSRDAKNRCKKRVRFIGAEVLTYSEQSTGIADQMLKATGHVRPGEGLAASYGPLKSCLSKSSRAACRSYLDFKSKGNKRAAEPSESESNGRVARTGKPRVGLFCAPPSRGREELTGRMVAVGDSSSADSDDGIEQEILRFLAEKARVNNELEECSKDEVQGFNEPEEESRSSQVPAQDRTMPPVSQQTEESRGVGVKGPRHVKEEVVAGYSHSGAERTGAESKADVNGQNLIQDIGRACSAQHQTEHRQVIGESQTETKAGIVQGRLQVGSTDCPGKGAGSCQSGWHSDVSKGKRVNDTPESCITQNIQGKRAALSLESRHHLVEELSVRYNGPRQGGAGELQLKVVQDKSSEKIVNKLKLWPVFPNEPLGETVEIGGEEGTGREADCSGDSKSDVGGSTDQSLLAAVNTPSSVGWERSAKVKCEEGGRTGRPFRSLMPSVSLGAHSSEARGLLCVARQDESDHNYQSGMRSEVREQCDAGLARSNCVTQRLCEMTGPSGYVSVAACTKLSIREETSWIEKRGHSVGLATETDRHLEAVIPEGASEGETSGQCTGRGDGVAFPAPQWQVLSQSLSGTKNEEENNRGTETGETAEGESPETFYDEAIVQSDDDGRADTGRSGLQGQGAEVSKGTVLVGEEMEKSTELW
ncbi:protein phosphatase 1 regulatory subunit 26 [Heptranchias perlo]|uniref:protein phosphatase 1 regulatory subunit 26 n=1 Tax=Heptranchias perlo TaxID=212740 RepID=UPI00355A1A5B